MANSTSGSPIVLDTAVANWTALLLPNGMPLDVRSILWLNPTASGDTVTIKNADGLVLYTAICEAASGNPGNSQIRYFQPREMLFTKPQGWYLQQITSGTLYIDFVYA